MVHVIEASMHCVTRQLTYYIVNTIFVRAARQLTCMLKLKYLAIFVSVTERIKVGVRNGTRIVSSRMMNGLQLSVLTSRRVGTFS